MKTELAVLVVKGTSAHSEIKPSFLGVSLSHETVELYLCTQNLFDLTCFLGEVPLAE